MMDVLEATRNVTEPVIQYWYVNTLSLVQRGGLPPHLSAAAHHHLRQRSRRKWPEAFQAAVFERG